MSKQNLYFKKSKKISMVNVGLFIKIDVKHGREADLDILLRSGVLLAQDEPATSAWFAIRMGPSTFGIFSAFLNDSGRQEHLGGKIIKLLMEKAADLFVQSPKI